MSGTLSIRKLKPSSDTNIYELKLTNETLSDGKKTIICALIEKAGLECHFNSNYAKAHDAQKLTNYGRMFT